MQNDTQIIEDVLQDTVPNVIEVNNVTMAFRMTTQKITSLKEFFIKKLKRQVKYNDFIALDGVSFTVKKGEVVGLIGLNGSGKSTTLKIISGILKPTGGSVSVTGAISPLIELGAGFDFDLTARENVYLNGSVLGFSHKEMESKMDDIIEFSELHDFMDTPIKNFSSGMIARLGFSIATNVIPELLIVDEILAVGDFLFQQKCEARINELMSGGTTVLIVSHSIEQIERLCDRVVWLEHGKVRKIGPTAEVCAEYKTLSC